MSNKDKIDQILLLSEEVRKDTGQSPLYNYGYREIMHREVLKKIFPSLQRSLGSHGSDANTDEIDFIEFKSGFWTKKTDPTIQDWKPIMFDMSKKKDQIFSEFIKISKKVFAPIRKYGSAALDMAYVASGRFDGYWQRELNYWDIAAGIIIVKEAGGFIDFFEEDTTAPLKKNILATNSNIHEELRGLIKKKDIE